MDIGKIYKKYKDGASFTDEEVNFAAEEFQKLANLLRLMGERFHFAWREAYDMYNHFEYFKQARARK
jgi:hypothetical protein